MKSSQIKALINLLGKETGQQAILLRRELAQLVKQNPQALKEVIATDFNSSLPMPFIYAMQEIAWDELFDHTIHFAEKINPELEEALCLVTRFVNPAFTSKEITEMLDGLALQLKPILSNCNSAVDIWQTLSRFFFHTQAFTVLSCARDVKDVSFGRFVQKKQGSSLCMCCLYTVCANRFGLEAGVVDLAGRVLAGVFSQDGSEPVFADPLDGGKLLTIQDCKNYIQSRNLTWDDQFLIPLSSHTLLRRFLANMIFILNKVQDHRRLSYLHRYMDVLAR